MLFSVVDIDCSGLCHSSVLLLMILTVNSVLSVATDEDLCNLLMVVYWIYTETRCLYFVM